MLRDFSMSPLQLGVGVSRGVEAAVHATRDFVHSMGSTDALIKLDFINAFNCIRRDTFLEAVAHHIPDACTRPHACCILTVKRTFLATKGISSHRWKGCSSHRSSSLLFGLAARSNFV